jgi:hypothetical protein
VNKIFTFLWRILIDINRKELRSDGGISHCVAAHWPCCLDMEFNLREVVLLKLSGVVVKPLRY